MAAARRPFLAETGAGEGLTVVGKVGGAGEAVEEEREVEDLDVASLANTSSSFSSSLITSQTSSSSFSVDAIKDAKLLEGFVLGVFFGVLDPADSLSCEAAALALALILSYSVTTSSAPAPCEAAAVGVAVGVAGAVAGAVAGGPEVSSCSTSITSHSSASISGTLTWVSDLDRVKSRSAKKVKVKNISGLRRNM